MQMAGIGWECRKNICGMMDMNDTIGKHAA
jgi:hypothetical protein